MLVLFCWCLFVSFLLNFFWFFLKILYNFSDFWFDVFLICQNFSMYFADFLNSFGVFKTTLRLQTKSVEADIRWNVLNVRDGVASLANTWYTFYEHLVNFLQISCDILMIVLSTSSKQLRDVLRFCLSFLLTPDELLMNFLPTFCKLITDILQFLMSFLQIVCKFLTDVFQFLINFLWNF